MLLVLVAVLLLVVLVGGGFSLHWLWVAAIVLLIFWLAVEVAQHERPPRSGP